MYKGLIIAEAGSVHDGSFGNAKCLIDLAKACGANAIKFQTHIAEAETLPNAPNPPYFKAESRFDYFKRTGFSRTQWIELKNYSKESGLNFISSPFSFEAVELLCDIGVDIIKIASGEVTNLPMLKAIAKTDLPVLLSSGMSSWKELDDAVSAVRSGAWLGVLQCSSVYPCPPSMVGLNVMQELHNRYNVPFGLSDHTAGIAASIAAATLGATIIEKHLTFSKKMYGSDAANALEPEQFKLMADGVKEVWAMLDSPVNKNDLTSYIEMKKIFEKSVVAKKDIVAGTILTMDMLCVKKPGTGIPASKLESLIGSKAKVDIPIDKLVLWEELSF